MTFLDRLGIPVTPLIWACLGLCVLTTSAGWYIAAAQRDAAIQERDGKADQLDTWKDRVNDLSTANAGFGNVLETFRAELSACQGEARRVDEAGRKAVDAAHADAKDAERTLAAFTAKFQTQSRQPACQQALAQMEAQCPALSDY